jgi:TRAP-type C4-dicarboxylate transport system permease small subunit
LDNLIWLGLAAIIIFHSLSLVEMQANLDSTLEGTDSVPLWVATATVPLGWALIAVRALQDTAQLIGEYRRGIEPSHDFGILLEREEARHESGRP